MSQRRISILATILVSAAVSAGTSVAVTSWSGHDHEAGAAPQTAREGPRARPNAADNAARTGGVPAPETTDRSLVITTPRGMEDERLRRKLHLVSSGFDLGSVLYVMGKEVGAANDEHDVLVTIPGQGEWDVAVEVYSEEGHLKLSRRTRIVATVPTYELDRLLEVTKKMRHSPAAVTLRDLRAVRDLLGDEAIDSIVQFARMPRGRLSVRRQALLLVAEVGHVRAADALLPLIEDVPELRRHVEVVLDQICGGELPVEIQMDPPVTYGKTAPSSHSEWSRWLGVNRDLLVELRSRFVAKSE